MTPADYDLVRAHLGVNRQDFAGALGLDVRTSRGYADGVRPIPRVVALACWALVMGPRVEGVWPGGELGEWLKEEG